MEKRHSGFSLVEIVLALGILSFAIVAILGLFPIAMRDAKDSKNETHAAMIAQLILGQLRSQPVADSSFPIGTNATDSASTWSVRLFNQGNYYAFYDEAGMPLRRATASQYDTAAVPSNMTEPVYKVWMNISTNSIQPGVSKVTIDVTYPCRTPLANRSVYHFATLIHNADQ